MPKKFWNDCQEKAHRTHWGWLIIAAIAIGIVLGWLIGHGGIE